MSIFNVFVYRSKYDSDDIKKYIDINVDNMYIFYYYNDTGTCPNEDRVRAGARYKE